MLKSHNTKKIKPKTLKKTHIFVEPCIFASLMCLAGWGVQLEGKPVDAVPIIESEGHNNQQIVSITAQTIEDL